MRKRASDLKTSRPNSPHALVQLVPPQILALIQLLDPKMHLGTKSGWTDTETISWQTRKLELEITDELDSINVSCWHAERMSLDGCDRSLFMSVVKYEKIKNKQFSGQSDKLLIVTDSRMISSPSLWHFYVKTTSTRTFLFTRAISNCCIRFTWCSVDQHVRIQMSEIT